MAVFDQFPDVTAGDDAKECRWNSDGKQYKFKKDSILEYLGGNSIINRKSNLKNLLGDQK